MMNKFAKYVVIPMLCFATNFAYAANIKDYPRVAVMDFGNKAITSRGLRGHDMTMATEYAIYQLSACGWFDLIDYEQLNAIAQMHKINMSGFIDQGTAVQMGKIAGAQFMVIGNVTGLTTKENIAGLRAHNAKAGNAQHVVNANVTIRIVDIETGRIVAAGIGKGSSTSTMTEFGFTKYRTKENVRTKDVGSTVINEIVDEAVTQTTQQRTSKNDTDVNVGGSDFNKAGTAGSDSYYKNNANQHGTSSSEYNNRGYAEDYRDRRGSQTDDINRRGSSSSSHTEENAQIGASYEEAERSGNRDFKYGESGLAVSGGPAEGVIWGKNQNQTWDVTVYNKEAEYYTNSSGGDAHYNDQAGRNDGYIAAQTEDIRDNASYNDDYYRHSSYGDQDQRMQMDTRHINSNSEYDDNQTSSGNSGTRSRYNDYGSDSHYDINAKNSDYADDYRDIVTNKANNRTSIDTENKFITYDEEAINYSVVIGTVEVSDVQVRNAISKAVRDAIYGKTGIMTVLNNGKQLKIKTGF